MVAGFQEELDSEDDASPFKPTNSSQQAPVVTSYDVELSSEEEEVPVVARDIDLSDEEKPRKQKPSSSQKSANHKQSESASASLDGVVSVFTNSAKGRDEKESATTNSSKQKSKRNDTGSPLSPEQPASSDSASEDEQTREVGI